MNDTTQNAPVYGCNSENCTCKSFIQKPLGPSRTFWIIVSLLLVAFIASATRITSDYLEQLRLQEIYLKPKSTTAIG
jgi:hypothetical protein